MHIPDGVYSVFGKAQAMGGKTHFMETWVTTQICAAYPGHVLQTFHCRYPGIRRTHTGAWVRQGRRYSTYALAVAARDRDASWVLVLPKTKAT
jgi:ABC-type sulfate transport system permease subunit